MQDIRFPNSTSVLVQVNQIFNLHNCLLSISEKVYIQRCVTQ